MCGTFYIQIIFNNQNIDGMIRLITSGNPEKFALKVKKY